MGRGFVGKCELFFRDTWQLVSLSHIICDVYCILTYKLIDEREQSNLYNGGFSNPTLSPIP